LISAAFFVIIAVHTNTLDQTNKTAVVATLNISQYVSRLEVKDDAPKQTLEELLEEWDNNRNAVYQAMKFLLRK